MLDASGPGNPVIVRAYRYDGVGRLTREQVTERGEVVVRTTDYGYDKVGNRSTRSESTAAGTETVAYTYDGNDRLTQELKTTATNSQVLTGYTWDANGNLATKTVGGAVTVYLWNAENRLTEVKQGAAPGSAQTVAKYSYDATGNRIQKIEPGQNGQLEKVTTYLIDSTFAYAQTVQESVSQGGTSESTNYLWGAGLIAQARGGQEMFYHADGLGSVKELSDASGTGKDAFQYDAFGTVESHSGTTENAYRYTGEYFDEQIGLQYNRARWYDSAIGRFVSQDSFAGAPKRPHSLNKYAYANADPSNVTDPSGLFGLTEVGAANSIAGTLNNLQINFGFDFVSQALDGDSDSSSANGWAALASLAPFAIGQIAKKSIKIVSTIGSKGKVAYSAKKIPLDKEIDAANFLSEHLGAGIYIRGGAATQGADFFISGVKWELKTLESATNESVKNNIKKALKQSSRVVIDGRSVGLTEVEALRGVARATGVGNVPAELMIILKDGKLLTWP